MLEMRKGCKVPFPEKLEEGYKIADNQIIANVSADKIEDVMAHFICEHKEPMFFILELPSKLDDETEVSTGVLSALHNDVFYIDGCSAQEALTVLNRIGKLAINDGFCVFGFGGHESHDEIVFGKYNVTTIFSENISDFDDFFEAHDIPKTDNLILAWDTFSQDAPGECEKVQTDGQDVYSIVEQFAEWGIYKAEQRETD